MTTGSGVGTSFGKRTISVVEILCSHCGTTITRPASQQRKRERAGYKKSYCSKACKDAGIPPAPQVELTCGHCGETFVRALSEAIKNDGKHHYCSTLCRNRQADVMRRTVTCRTCGA